MDEELLEAFDLLDDQLDFLRSLVNKWDQVCFALYEEVRDAPNLDTTKMVADAEAACQSVLASANFARVMLEDVKEMLG